MRLGVTKQTRAASGLNAFRFTVQFEEEVVQSLLFVYQQSSHIQSIIAD